MVLAIPPELAATATEATAVVAALFLFTIRYADTVLCNALKAHCAFAALASAPVASTLLSFAGGNTFALAFHALMVLLDTLAAASSAPVVTAFHPEAVRFTWRWLAQSLFAGPFFVAISARAVASVGSAFHSFAVRLAGWAYAEALFAFHFTHAEPALAAARVVAALLAIAFRHALARPVYADLVLRALSTSSPTAVRPADLGHAVGDAVVLEACTVGTRESLFTFAATTTTAIVPAHQIVTVGLARFRAEVVHTLKAFVATTAFAQNDQSALADALFFTGNGSGPGLLICTAGC